MKITRLNILRLETADVAKDLVSTLRHLCPTDEEYNEHMTKEMTEEELAPFKHEAKEDPKSKYRALFPEHVEEWAWFDKQRAKRRRYILQGIPYEILEDGTVVKREQADTK